MLDAGRKKIMESHLTLAVLVALYPALFFISKNWFVVGVTQSFLILLVLTVFSFLTVFVTWLVLSYVPKLKFGEGKEPKLSFIRVPEGIVGTIIFIEGLFILAGYLDFAIVENDESYGHYIRIIIGIVGAVMLLVKFKSGKKDEWPKFFKSANSILCFLIIMNLGMLTLSIVENYDKVSPEKTNAGESSASPVRLKKKPNIYLIVPDGYPTHYVLKNLFKFDNQAFEDQLISYGFKIYDNYFASYPYSLEGMHSLLAMRHTYFKKSTETDALGIREELGLAGNGVVKILSENGYKSHFLHSSDYIFEKGCFVSECEPSESVKAKLVDNLEMFYFFKFLKRGPRNYDVDSHVRHFIKETNPGDQKFMYKHYMRTHGGMKTYNESKKKKLPSFRKSFVKKVQRTNEVIISEIKQISKKDPEALIVIVGDHGTWGGAERTDSGLTEDEILDKFSVFLAIKWGKDYQGQYDQDIKASVNLFRYIFAYLSDSEDILKSKVENTSYFRHKKKVWKVVEDGKVITSAEPLE